MSRHFSDAQIGEEHYYGAQMKEEQAWGGVGFHRHYRGTEFVETISY